MRRLLLTIAIAASLSGQTISGINERLNQMNLSQLPAGFSVAAKSGATGQALTANLADAQSAKAAFRAALRQVAPYFDKMPALQSAMADQKDQQVQAFFRASFHGTPVRGLMIVAAQNGSARGAIFFDREDLFQSSLPVLSKQLAASMPKPAPGNEPVALTRTPLPDGSGWVSLAPGWQITGAFKGTVDAVGPNGEIMSLGGYQQIFMQAYPNSTLMFGAYRPPWPAWQLFVDCLNKGAVSRGEIKIRQLEMVPDKFPGGEAAWISYEQSLGGKTFRGLAWVATARIPSDIPIWMFYASVVGAPGELYAKELPTLVAMWKSWGINQAVFRERMDAALRSMRETFRIMQEVHDTRQKAYDRANLAQDETIRGVTMIEDVTDHARGEVDTSNAQWIVDEANRRGYNFRIVPLAELIP